MAASARRSSSELSARKLQWSAFKSPVESSADCLWLFVTFELRKKRKIWVSKCLELGTASFGDTLEAAKQELIDLTVIHLNGLEEAGLRERVFVERGLKLHRKRSPETPPAERPGTIVQLFEARAA
jgi:hypothetical protein